MKNRPRLPTARGSSPTLPSALSTALQAPNPAYFKRKPRLRKFSASPTSLLLSLDEFDIDSSSSDTDTYDEDDSVDPSWVVESWELKMRKDNPKKVPAPKIKKPKKKVKRKNDVKIYYPSSPTSLYGNCVMATSTKSLPIDTELPLFSTNTPKTEERRRTLSPGRSKLHNQKVEGTKTNHREEGTKTEVTIRIDVDTDSSDNSNTSLKLPRRSRSFRVTRPKYLDFQLETTLSARHLDTCAVTPRTPAGSKKTKKKKIRSELTSRRSLPTPSKFSSSKPLSHSRKNTSLAIRRINSASPHNTTQNLKVSSYEDISSKTMKGASTSCSSIRTVRTVSNVHGRSMNDIDFNKLIDNNADTKIVFLFDKLKISKHLDLFFKEEIEYEDLFYFTVEDFKKVGLPFGPAVRLYSSLHPDKTKKEVTKDQEETETLEGDKITHLENQVKNLHETLTTLKREKQQEKEKKDKERKVEHGSGILFWKRGSLTHVNTIQKKKK